MGNWETLLAIAIAATVVSVRNERKRSKLEQEAKKRELEKMINLDDVEIKKDIELDKVEEPVVKQKKK